MKNISNNAIVVGIVGLVLGLVLGLVIGNSGAGVKSPLLNSAKIDKDASITEDTKLKNGLTMISDIPSGTSVESQSAILVNNQLAGDLVTVASVETDTMSWVVVREDSNGILGNILGASRIDSGDSNNIVVPLLRPTVAGQTYKIVLFEDNGDRVFDHKIDLPMTSGGVLITSTFSVQ